MADFIHQNLANGRWFEMTLCEQMGNIGSEVGRAAKWHAKGNFTNRDNSLERAFDLLDMSISDKRWGVGLKEICRAREVLADTFFGDKEYNDTPEKLEKYFFQFAVAARSGK